MTLKKLNTIEKAVAKLGESAYEKQSSKHAHEAQADEQKITSNTSGDNEKFFCQLDSESLKAQGYLTMSTQSSEMAEEYRGIKRPVLKNAFGKMASLTERSNLVMLTSAVAGEGKTFTAINLALSIALEKDTTVLLVDSDVINPRLTRLHGLEDRPGLTNLLEDADCQLQDVIVNTNIPNLRILPAGKAHDYSTELLASEAMERVAAELSERYKDRIVLFDAPPLLMTSQAKVLANIVGQVLIVVAAGKTSRKVITDVIEELGKDKVAGIILNACNPKSVQYNRGYAGLYNQ